MRPENVERLELSSTNSSSAAETMRHFISSSSAATAASGAAPRRSRRATSLQLDRCFSVPLTVTVIAPDGRGRSGCIAVERVRQ
jgi:hypothetical protein